VLFFGCEGDTGRRGPAGPPGTGVQANETCVICHAEGHIADVGEVHDTATGTVTAVINSLLFGDDGAGNLIAVIDFSFAAMDTSGNPVAVDLTEPISDTDTRLAHVRFTVGRLLPGQVYPLPENKDPDAWIFYGASSHRESSNLVDNLDGTYTFTDTELDTLVVNFDGSLTHRVGIEIYDLPSGLRSVNPTFDVVPNGGPILTREIVTTEACNECHNPLGYTPRFHGSRRVETKHCQLCHNLNNDLAGNGPINFAFLIHGIHSSQDLNLFEDGEPIGDFTEVLFPQDIRNCTKCHKGGVDSDNWKNRPNMQACATCHLISFEDPPAPGLEPHPGGVQADNSFCATCHPPSSIEAAHATENVSPNNPQLPAGLSKFEYFIDDVTVDPATGVATVYFRIEADGLPFDLQFWEDNEEIAFTDNSPSFLLAWALSQDGIAEPADYTNTNSPAPPSSSTGNGAGDAVSVSIGSLWAGGNITGDPTGYVATIPTRPFPSGATMRAVAIQGYFTQIVPDGDDEDNLPDEVGRHTPSVVMPVPGDAVRRQVVKSGYDSVTGQPFGCLECHEVLELHGGSRVNNPQVCVMCHNPNKSSSGRTVDPTQPIPPETVAAVGSDPLLYPEATNNFKNMIHGIHRASDRPYEFVRNRLNGLYYNWSEVTFPGDRRYCEKCHLENTYRPENLPSNVLWNVERTTTGDPDESREDIIEARSTVPNLTDLVSSPIAGACYYCHDEPVTADHILLQGGHLRTTREESLEVQ